MPAEEFDVTGSVSGSSYGTISNGNPVVVRDPRDTRITLSRATIPQEYYLAQNYPNPFNPTTTIAFGLPEHQKVSLKVFDVLGREVCSVANDVEYKPGNHKMQWDASRYASGVYFLRMQAGSFTGLSKMMLIR